MALVSRTSELNRLRGSTPLLSAYGTASQLAMALALSTSERNCLERSTRSCSAYGRLPELATGHLGKMRRDQSCAGSSPASSAYGIVWRKVSQRFAKPPPERTCRFDPCRFRLLPCSSSWQSAEPLTRMLRVRATPGQPMFQKIVLLDFVFMLHWLSYRGWKRFVPLGVKYSPYGTGLHRIFARLPDRRLTEWEINQIAEQLDSLNLKYGLPTR